MIDPITGTLLGVSVASSVIGAVKGAESERQGRKAADRRLRKMAEDINAIPLPQLKDLALKDPSWLGDIAPLLPKEKFEALGLPEEITTDPRFRQAQMDTLSTLETISKEGMTDQDKLNLEAIRQRSDRGAAASRKAAMQSMAERGMGGAGAELAQALQAEQATAQQRGMEGLQIAADKRNAALNAMMQRGNMATSMRGQEFGEKESNRQARMLREDFNKRMAQDVQARNIGAERAALYRDIEGRQAMENAEADRRNQEERYNIDKDERRFKYDMEKMRAKHGLDSARADMDIKAGQAGAREAGAWGQVIPGAVKAYSSMEAGDRQREHEKDLAKIKYGK
jgi:hypothetical protein